MRDGCGVGLNSAKRLKRENRDQRWESQTRAVLS
jgi:hypothetical protein